MLRPIGRSINNNYAVICGSAMEAVVPTSFLLLIVMVGGISSYFSMGKLEDSLFTIKTALVITQYPGASAHEVEQEVTEVIERAAQSRHGSREYRRDDEPG